MPDHSVSNKSQWRGTIRPLRARVLAAADEIDWHPSENIVRIVVQLLGALGAETCCCGGVFVPHSASLSGVEVERRSFREAHESCRTATDASTGTGVGWPLTVYVCEQCRRPSLFRDDRCCSGFVEEVLVEPRDLNRKLPDA